MAAGETDKAISRLRSSIDLDSSIFETHYNLGIALIAAHEYKDAQEAFKNALKLKPDYAYAYYALGLAYEKEENLEKSIDNYEKFVQYTQDKSLRNNVQNKINNLKKQLPDEVLTEE